MDSLNINNLPDFIRNYEIDPQEHVFTFNDNELYATYQRIKNRHAGRSITQQFFADIGDLNSRSLHSFVSRNRITDETFKSRLIRVLFVLEFSSDAPSLSERIWKTFPATVFTRSGSPNQGRPLVIEPVSNTIANTRDELSVAHLKIDSLQQENLSKQVELNVALSESELLRRKFLNKEIELNQARTTIEERNAEIIRLKADSEQLRTASVPKSMESKYTQTEAKAAMPKPSQKLPFNWFV